MRNVLRYRKIFQNGSMRLRFGCGYIFNLLMFSTVRVHVLDLSAVVLRIHLSANLGLYPFQENKNETIVHFLLQLNISEARLILSHYKLTSVLALRVPAATLHLDKGFSNP